MFCYVKKNRQHSLSENWSRSIILTSAPMCNMGYLPRECTSQHYCSACAFFVRFKAVRGQFFSAILLSAVFVWGRVQEPGALSITFDLDVVVSVWSRQRFLAVQRHARISKVNICTSIWRFMKIRSCLPYTGLSVSTSVWHTRYLSSYLFILSSLGMLRLSVRPFFVLQCLGCQVIGKRSAWRKRIVRPLDYCCIGFSIALAISSNCSCEFIIVHPMCFLCWKVAGYDRIYALNCLHSRMEALNFE